MCEYVYIQAHTHTHRVHFIYRRFLAKQLLKRMKAQAKKEEEEVRLMCEELSKMSAYIYKAQMDHIELDKQRHKEKVSTHG